MKIGIGYDIHRLIEDRPLMLGGINIPYVKGLLGYSDGDALLHAIADAILGGIARGDIGEMFPDTDPQFKDISSAKILGQVADVARQEGYAVHNVDTVIIAEEPKVYPYKAAMVTAIAKILSIDEKRVNIKATTAEGVGSLGKGDAIAAYAAVTLDEV